MIIRRSDEAASKSVEFRPRLADDAARPPAPRRAKPTHPTARPDSPQRQRRGSHYRPVRHRSLEKGQRLSGQNVQENTANDRRGFKNWVYNAEPVCTKDPVFVRKLAVG